MANNYKVGDKVVCIEAGSNSLTNGHEYVVVKDTAFGDQDVRVENDNGSEYSYYDWRFKPVKNAPAPAPANDLTYSIDRVNGGSVSINIQGKLTSAQVAAVLTAIGGV